MSPRQRTTPLKAVVERLRHTIHQRAIEWLLAGITLTWGVMVLCNPNLFSTRHYWAEMLAMMPQVYWGWTVFILGSVRWIALAINGGWRPTPHIRAICAMLNVPVWMLITFAIGHSGHAAMGLAVYPWFVIADFYSCLKAAKEARTVDDVARFSSLKVA